MRYEMKVKSEQFLTCQDYLYSKIISKFFSDDFTKKNPANDFAIKQYFTSILAII